MRLHFFVTITSSQIATRPDFNMWLRQKKVFNCGFCK